MVGIVVQREISEQNRLSIVLVKKKLFLLTEMVNQIDYTDDDGYNYG